MITRGFFLNHHSLPRRIKSSQQHGRFHLRRRHRNFVTHRNRIFCANYGHRQASTGTPHRGRSKQRNRISNPRHRTAVQAGVSREGHRDVAGRHCAHNQTHTCARVAAVNHRVRLGKPAHAHTMHRPIAFAVVDHLCAKSRHGFAGVEHVFAFQQAGDFGLAHCHRSKDQAAMADRLITRHMRLALQRTASGRSHRNGCAVARHSASSLLLLTTLLAQQMPKVHGRNGAIVAPSLQRRSYVLRKVR
mmetsp:Transcript_13705/g.21952  ORF Transcript_13705/g.21952 Transcript_13705/m.21952 type:complete len:246 (+) Transcript_13705:1144-1881(+)